MSKPQMYLFIDIEADGPAPGMHSMRNFGAALFDSEGNCVDGFERNLKPLGYPAHADPDTMERFWAHNEEAWEYVNTDTVPPKQAMGEFCAWVDRIRADGYAVVMCSDVSFDFMWIRWYAQRFVPEFGCPWSFLDVRSFMFGATDSTEFYRTRENKRLLRRLGPEERAALPEHDHTGMSDATRLGMLFMPYLRERKAPQAAPHGGEE